jgi:hypothetical protein
MRTHLSLSPPDASAAEPSAPRAKRRRTPAHRARARFLAFYPHGFADDSYVELERGYKWRAHEQWRTSLARNEFHRLLSARQYRAIAQRAVRIESRTNLLFSFEKMALRDAVASEDGQRCFAEALFAWLHGPGAPSRRFETWVAALERLPRRQTRVLTWPLATVFGFLAQPRRHLFVKPNVTRAAARFYHFAFDYKSRPNWSTYRQALDFAAVVMRDTADLRPRDLIDAQSFIWVLGSDEYD